VGALEIPTYASAFAVTDRTAAWGQRVDLRLTRLELGLLVLGALAGFLSVEAGRNGPDLGGVLAALLFTGSLALRAYRMTVRPTSVWQDGRAAAESIKTLCWRYAAGSRTFPADLDDARADELLVERLREILSGIRELAVVHPTGAPREQITPWMRQLRRAPLEERRRVYEQARIDDQQHWYAARAERNRREAHRWSLLVLGFEVLGVLAGVLKAFDLVDLNWSTGDLVGVAAALGAAATAWAQTRQYSTLASAYRIAEEELSAIRTLVPHTRSDAEWEQFVDSTEAAISREHTMWRASRT
jgi:hypothetical protein